MQRIESLKWNWARNILNCGVRTTSGQTTRKMDELDQANGGEKLSVNGETNIEETEESFTTYKSLNNW